MKDLTFFSETSTKLLLFSSDGKLRNVLNFTKTYSVRGALITKSYLKSETLIFKNHFKWPVDDGDFL